MKLPGRLAAAMEVLTDIETRHRPVSSALKDWGIGHRFAGSGDRAAIGNLVYDALRSRASHAFAMGEDTPRALVLSVAVRDWDQDPVELNASFEGDKFAPDALSDDELARLTSEEPLKGAPDHVLADVPEWLAESFKGAFGDTWVVEGEGLTERPPLDLRINGVKGDIGRVVKSLQRFPTAATQIAPSGLRILAGTGPSRTPNVQSDEAYLKGWFEVQDEGSQVVSALVGAKPGEQILDYCAGAGGKSLAMAADMENKGQIFAHDSDRSRLAPIYDRLKRAGVHNVQTRSPEPKAMEDLLGKIDRVLVDAPCSGAGTWRRRPDAKWRLSEDQLNQRLTEQAQILESAAEFVQHGGELVYVTCSVLPQENEAQIKAFLAKHTDFAVRDMKQVWTERFGGGREVPPHVSPEGLTLTPATTETDGFFISVMRRTVSG